MAEVGCCESVEKAPFAHVINQAGGTVNGACLW